ncbi:hypothetical protein [Neobacillus mesonae]|uniref:CD-NTase associated protein 4-like DNA endonuclease domain-containing protein n=1 Tax=Neobacillus mesonae TaxID=1193713 RepID=A0A3T0HX09_9BACI|nr:hypothetical protein [Neobacillus mesonae]AZU61680.1 hypothetical protein CHR53_10545 [Neobacillus mesonae]
MQDFNIETVNRDASDKYKGFRYQKFRVAIKMLQLIKLNSKNNIIALPESREDGHFIDDEGHEHLEQDKLYEKGFSFNSSEILKTMTNFLDNYIELKKDPYINFIFFTNTSYVSENQTKKLTQIGLNVLEKPILEYLVEKDFNDDVVNFISKYLIHTYRETYSIEEDKPETYHINYLTIKKMVNYDWVEFLEKISFKFDESDLETLSQELDKEIKECQFFSTEHFGKENLIKRNLLDVIDERMTQKHVTQKIINVDSVRIIYKEAESMNSELVIDEIYPYWDDVENELEGEVLRNLKEKILTVCPEFNDNTIKRYTRDAATVKDEIKRFDKRQINSLKYRVYESMEKFFDEEFKYNESFTYEHLNKIIRTLREYVVADLNQLKKDYNYGVRNDITVQKVAMLLIDECFYSFDEV